MIRWHFYNFLLHRVVQKSIFDAEQIKFLTPKNFCCCFGLLMFLGHYWQTRVKVKDTSNSIVKNILTKKSQAATFQKSRISKGADKKTFLLNAVSGKMDLVKFCEHFRTRIVRYQI